MRFDWNPEKNEQLKKERNISFETIALLMGNGIIWKVSDHPNKKKYPNQKVFFVPIDNYVYMVPCVIDKDGIFLKTAIPSRKATKQYKKELEGNHE